MPRIIELGTFWVIVNSKMVYFFDFESWLNGQYREDDMTTLGGVS